MAKKKETIVQKIKKEAKELVREAKSIEKKVEEKIAGKPEAKKEKKEVEIGEVTNYFERIGVAAIKLSKAVNVGDKVKFKGGEVEFEQTIGSMQIHGKPVDKAEKGDEIGVKVNQRANKGYRVLAA